MPTVMIVDDHALIRRIVREILVKESDLEVVAEACNGLDAEQQATQIQPDVVLMDLDMPDCNGFEATKRVQACSPKSRVVIFTASHQEQHIFHAIQCGATGYITKDIEPDSLVHAVRSAIRNDFYIPSSIASHVLTRLRTQPMSPETPIAEARTTRGQFSARSTVAADIPSRTSRRSSYKTAQPRATTLVAEAPVATAQAPKRPLTEREQEILDLMRRGRKNREIAGELCIAESTVHKHVQNIFEKLHARNRTEAIYLTSVAR